MWFLSDLGHQVPMPMYKVELSNLQSSDNLLHFKFSTALMKHRTDHMYMQSSSSTLKKFISPQKTPKKFGQNAQKRHTLQCFMTLNFPSVATSSRGFDTIRICEVHKQKEDAKKKKKLHPSALIPVALISSSMTFDLSCPGFTVQIRVHDLCPVDQDQAQGGSNDAEP